MYLWDHLERFWGCRKRLPKYLVLMLLGNPLLPYLVLMSRKHYPLQLDQRENDIWAFNLDGSAVLEGETDSEATMLKTGFRRDELPQADMDAADHFHPLWAGVAGNVLPVWCNACRFAIPFCTFLFNSIVCYSGEGGEGSTTTSCRAMASCMARQPCGNQGKSLGVSCERALLVSQTITACMQLCDIQDDGENRLLIADSSRMLKIYKGS